MKYYAVCDVIGNYEYELRRIWEVNNGLSDECERYVIYDNEIDALKECNEVNLNREKPICVVKELEV